jgi:hypothetical protein
MSESAQTPATSGAPAAGKSATSKKSGGSAAVVVAVGALLTVAAIGLVLKRADISFSKGDPSQPTVTFVTQNEIGAAATTLTPSAAAALADDAQRCKIPLASMTIEKGAAPIGSTIRIRAGSYVSPYFAVTEGMQRIAMPYPAPYGSGAGTFVIEGTAKGAILGLNPTKVLDDLPGTQRIPVVWRAVSPC